MTGRPDLDRPFVRHAIAAACGLLAFALRLWALGSQELWLDEALTAHIAWAPDGLDFVHNTPPLYFVLVRGWTAAFGIDPIGLRSLSLVAGALFVWAAPLVAREAFGNRAALPTACVALLLPMHVYYSQEARAYALLMLELLVAFWLLWRLRRRSSVATCVGLALCAAAALHTHYLTAIPLLLAWACIGLGHRRQPEGASTRTFLVTGLASVALVLPWMLWWSRHTVFRPADMAWLAALWESLSGPAAVLTSLELFGIGGQEGHSPVFLKQLTDLAFPATLRLGALAGLAAIALHALLRLRSEAPRVRAAALQALALLLGPLLGLWAVSLYKPVYCPGRYDMIALPGFVLFVGYAIGRLGALWRGAGKLAAVAVVGAVLAGVGAKDWFYLTATPSPDPYAAIAAHLTAEAAPDETVILSGDTGLLVLAHCYRDGWIWQGGTCRQAASGRAFGCRLLPTSLEAAPAAGMRFEEAVRDGSLDAGLKGLLAATSPRGVHLVMSARFQATAGGANGMATRLVRAVLEAGYEFAGAQPELGVGHYVKVP